MKIAILGAGALGSWFGGKIAKVNQDVTLLTTNLEHITAIQNDGLILRDLNGEERIDVKAMRPEEFRGPVDLVILLTKTFQSKAALASIADALSSNTSVLTLQNGLGNQEIIEAFVPEKQILLGNTMMPVDKIAPGIMQSRGDGTTWLSHLHESVAELCNTLTNTMTSAGLDVRIDEDIHQRIWHKVAFNSGMNAATALSHGTPGTIGDSPGAFEFVLAVAAETIEVAAAHGIDLDLASVKSTIEGACNNHKHHKSSMVQDLLAGRKTEVDSLNGAVVEFGQTKGIATPLNKMLHTLVTLAELSHMRYN